MNRHEFAWVNLAFGVAFLAGAGCWTAWRHDAFSMEQFAVVTPVLLIVVGLAGIVASLWRKK